MPAAHSNLEYLSTRDLASLLGSLISFGRFSFVRTVASAVRQEAGGLGRGACSCKHRRNVCESRPRLLTCTADGKASRLRYSIALTAVKLQL